MDTRIPFVARDATIGYHSTNLALGASFVCPSSDKRRTGPTVPANSKGCQFRILPNPTDRNSQRNHGFFYVTVMKDHIPESLAVTRHQTFQESFDCCLACRYSLPIAEENHGK